MWQQVYDPAGNPLLSTLLAALPVVVLLGALGFFKIKAHIAALWGLLAALIIAVFVFHMPAAMAAKTAVLGAMYGLLPIGWIVINVIFLYMLTFSTGRFKVLQDSVAGVTNDRRLQLLLVAFCFGAFFEGTSGFGTPVAVTGAILIGLGFSPLAASALSLIANTAPVAFGALGTPIFALQSATGIDANQLSLMIGRQLPLFSFILPFWLIWAFAGFKRMLEVWPAVLIAGLGFAVPQFLVSNYHGPTLVDVIASIVSMLALAALLKVWKPKTIMLGTTRDSEFVSPAEAELRMVRHTHTAAEVLSAWTPWLILAVVAFVWGLPPVKAAMNAFSNPQIAISGLHNLVERVPPVAPLHAKPESALFAFSWISASGSGIFVAALLAAAVMRISVSRVLKTYASTLYAVRFSLLTIAAMLALGYTTRYSGLTPPWDLPSLVLASSIRFLAHCSVG